MTDVLSASSDQTHSNGPTVAPLADTIKVVPLDGANGTHTSANLNGAHPEFPSSDGSKVDATVPPITVLVAYLWLILQQLMLVSTLLLNLQLMEAARQASKPAMPVASRLAERATTFTERAREQFKLRAVPWMDSACDRWEALGKWLSTMLILLVSKPVGVAGAKLLHCFFMELWMAGFFLCRWREPSGYVPTDDESVQLLSQLKTAPMLIVQRIRSLPPQLIAFGSAQVRRFLKTLFEVTRFAVDLVIGLFALLVPEVIQKGVIWVWACSSVGLDLLTGKFAGLQAWGSGLWQRSLSAVNSRITAAQQFYREPYQTMSTAISDFRQQGFPAWMTEKRERIFSNEYVQFIWSPVQTFAQFCYDVFIVVLVLPISSSFVLVGKLRNLSVGDCLTQCRSWTETARTTLASLPSRFVAFLFSALEVLLFPFYLSISLGQAAIERVKSYGRSARARGLYFYERVRVPLVLYGGQLSEARVAFVEQFRQGGLLGVFEFLTAQLRVRVQAAKTGASEKFTSVVNPESLVTTWQSLGTTLFHYAFAVCDLWLVRQLLAFIGLNRAYLTDQSMKIWMWVPSALGIRNKHIE